MSERHERKGDEELELGNARLRAHEIDNLNVCESIDIIFPQIQQLRTRSTVLAGSADVLSTRDNALTEVSPTLEGSTAAYALWYIDGTVASAVIHPVSHDGSPRRSYAVPMTALKTEGGPCGAGVGVGLGAALQGSSPSSRGTT